jgi:mono/diheme cytochrome c family protein
MVTRNSADYSVTRIEMGFSVTEWWQGMFRQFVPVITVVTLVVIIAVPAFSRLSPESSPVARGARYAASHPCSENDCRSELNGEVGCELLPSGTSCQDVILYWKAVRLKRLVDQRSTATPDNWLLRGEVLARARNCFRCHGELGQGGFANSGALKGYIPGYFGNDFRVLTEDRDRKIVKEWMRTGSSKALTGDFFTGFIANFFLNQQAVSMPVFASLPEQEIELLTSYVIFLNELGPLGEEEIDCYTSLTRRLNLVSFNNMPFGRNGKCLDQ